MSLTFYTFLINYVKGCNNNICNSECPYFRCQRFVCSGCESYELKCCLKHSIITNDEIKNYCLIQQKQLKL